VPALLPHINSPFDLRLLKEYELPKVVDELRAFLIESVLESGGHFSANLGTVELTVALHYVFNTPDDSLIWDVGHQAYGHKVLTGRRDELRTIRKKSGISGFPRIAESLFDDFGTGHSSTSISAALGMAEANRLQGKSHESIAVIGDGSLTAGMAWEALNNAGVSNSKLLIVVNDNQIGIDLNKGALNSYLGELGTRTDNIFSDLGFHYSGPVDGHDLGSLLEELKSLRYIDGSRLLHIKTVKGKGYEPAEVEQTKWHAVKYVKVRGEDGPVLKQNKYQEVFGEKLVDLAQNDDRIVGITPAMPSGSSMDLMMQRFPERVFDVGIAEQHAVTFSAGLALKGLIPICNIYSSFFQRAYDQVIHDVCLQKIPVVFCLDRAGVVGEDGPTHHGMFDLAFMRAIPNVEILAPSSGEMLEQCMEYAVSQREHPVVIRYPRGAADPQIGSDVKQITNGAGRTIHKGKNVAVLSLGTLLGQCAEACKLVQDSTGLELGLYDMIFLKPLAEDLIEDIFNNYEHIVTVEDGTVVGGFGSAIADLANAKGYQRKITHLGFPDSFIGHASRQELLQEHGLDANSIAKYLLKVVGSTVP